MSEPSKSLCNIPSRINWATSLCLETSPGQSDSLTSITRFSISSHDSTSESSIPSAVSFNASCRIEGAVIQSLTTPCIISLSFWTMSRWESIKFREAISRTLPPSSLVTCTNIGLVSLLKCSLILS